MVNEALNEDGTLRQSPWLQIIGEDYIAKAFQFAHEADPQASASGIPIAPAIDGSTPSCTGWR